MTPWRKYINSVLNFIALSFVFHLTWELIQSPLYTCSTDMTRCFWLCVHASLGDVVMTALIYLFYKTYPSFIWTTGVGFLLGLVVEKSSLLLDRWTYFPSMPLLPILNVGITPLLQMTLIPLLIIHIIREAHPSTRS